MNLSEYLGQLPDPAQLMAPQESWDLNLELLLERLELGAEPVLARILDGAESPLGDRCILFVVRAPEGDRVAGDRVAGDRREHLLVCPGPRTIELIRSRLGGVLLSIARANAPAADAEARTAGLLPAELKAVLARKTDLAPAARAAALMDWIMERIEARRCALVPFDGAVAAAPLHFGLRGKPHGSEDLRHVPRQILAHVARTRQPLVSHDVSDPENQLTAAATVLHQKIASYMAVPVVFRGKLLAVCYVDRFDRPRRFSDDEQLVFTAFAYEIAAPLLALLEDQRRADYYGIRDALLDADRRAGGNELVSVAFAPVLERARVLAPHVDESLLILGETGVGKEHLARFIHDRSGRSGPFTAVNLSAIPSEVFESELMGSVRGAFTDARDRVGRIAEAEAGTLFLDEIGDLSLMNQVNLLRFLENKTVRPIGATSERAVDVRVIAATNRPLRNMVASGEFRADLLHRFAPPLVVPPLRERGEELLPRADAFLDEAARRKGVPRPRLTADARRFLQSYAWPGNVRQLHLLLTHAALLASNRKIDAALLSSLAEGGTNEPGVALAAAPEDWDGYRAWQGAHERVWLKRALDENAGNVTATARQLGCAATTLRSALERHGLV